MIALRDPAVDAAVLAQLEKAEVATRVVALRALAFRRAQAALAELLKAAEDENQAVRTEALSLLPRVVGDKDVQALVKVLVATPPGKAREAAERALWASCLTIADPEKRLDPLLTVVQQGDVPTRAAILPVLGRLGGLKALAVIHAAMKDPNEPMRDAAVLALANWPDAAVAAELMQIAKTTPKAEQRITALRAFARVVAKPSPRLPQETFAMLKEALGLADRAEDRQYILSRFSGARTPEALALVMTYLDDPAVQAGAAVAAVGLADRLKQTHRAEARAALEKVLQVSKDEPLRAKATELLRRIK
jgi:HEAT repeat protein